MIGYVGTYSQNDSEGIYKFRFDSITGEIDGVELFARVSNSRYLAYDREILFSTFDSDKGSGVVAFDNSGNEIDRIITEKDGPCYIIINDNYIYTANYHEGIISKISFDNNKLALVAQTTIQSKAGAHQVVFYGEYLLVPCLLLDKIYILDSELQTVNTIDFPKGTGVRHCVFSQDFSMLYVICELSSELYTLSVTGLTFKIESILSLVTGNEVEGSAALRMSEDGNTLFVSTRGVDVISVVDISNDEPYLKQQVPSQGEHPRDILNVCSDSFLLVANRSSNELISFTIVENAIHNKVSSGLIPEAIAICMAE